MTEIRLTLPILLITLTALSTGEIKTSCLS
jgi:hypothetical protein